ncbi:MAG: glycosyltransferase family 2 protein [Nodosilinea sp.]
MSLDSHFLKISCSIFIIIPAHNRCATTLQCLNTLQRNGDLERYRVVVVDDGSTDGTATAIRSSYPSVTVFEEDGNLWWTGAIAKGMVYAYQQGADYFIWLNDDAFPYPNALSQLVQHCALAPKRIAAGQCYATTQLTEPTYGGQIKHLWSVELIATGSGEETSCDCMSGNVVCLPRSVVDDLGYPPADFLPHCHADIVYTLAAKRAGYDLQVLGDAIALCAFNPIEAGWASSPIPMSARWRQIKSLKSGIHPPTYWVYCHRVFGWWIGLLLFVGVYLKLLGFTIARWFIPVALLKQAKAYKDNLLQP